MTTQQPVWKFEAQLGDRNPIDYGGYWVLTDTTGVYPPEAELLVSPDSDDGQWTVYRFILEPCTFINGVLSENRYHPDYPVWFADELKAIADCQGIPLDNLIEMFTSDSAVERALAWRAVGDYEGFDNLDNYPLTITRRSEVEKRYSEHQYQETKS